MASLPSTAAPEESMIHDDSDDYGSEIDGVAAESDYGSDWDSAIVEHLTKTECTSLPEIVVLENELIEEEPEAQTHSLRLARVRSDDVEANALESPERRLQRLPSVEVEYDESNRVAFKSPGQDVEAEVEKPQTSPWKLPDKNDTRSPIERFRRTKRKKNMTVTDVVGPGYCEVKFWYNLTHYGKTPTTKAMKQGTKIHKQKEMEVHTEVPVAIATKEDKFGLRLWNIIQGLRTLRATGLTRELEVMGLVEGEVMIGIIDELTETCPDEQLEEAMLKRAEVAKASKGKKDAIPADQRFIMDFLPPPSSGVSITSTHGKPRMLYISDIKTRGSDQLPRASQMKQTEMQLMMYRRLLLELAANTVDPEIIFERYDVDPNKPFSDTFIASMGSIDFSSQPSCSDERNDANDEFFTPASTQQSQDPLEEVLAHTTLSSLWAHMIAEFARIVSVNLSSSNISDLLTAEFRKSDTGRVIGTRSFEYDGKELGPYVSDIMRWWKGEREPRGVEIEEAVKCRFCEFAEGCEWRKGKVVEVLEKARLKGEARKRSLV